MAEHVELVETRSIFDGVMGHEPRKDPEADKGGGISRFWSASLTLTHGRGGLFSWAWYTSRPAISDSCATRLTNISPWGRSQGFALFEPAAGQAQPLRPELARRKCDTRPAGSSSARLSPSGACTAQGCGG